MHSQQNGSKNVNEGLRVYRKFTGVPSSGSVDPEQLLLKKKRGDRICNLCLRRRQLTWDHVPPRCCGNSAPIISRRLYADERIAPQIPARSPNGLKFETLCQSCNSEIGHYDEALGDFAAKVKHITVSMVVMPRTITLKIQPARVLKSVLAHILASKLNTDQVPVDEKLRQYLQSGTLDPKVRLYYWLFPWRETIVARDFTFLHIVGDAGKSPGIVSVLKFYPLAFCLIHGEGEIGAASLHQFASAADLEYADVPLALSPLVHPYWPEKAMGNHLVLGGREYVDSVRATTAVAVEPVNGNMPTWVQRWQGADNDVFGEVYAFANVPRRRA